jgi:hypothetical protein
MPAGFACPVASVIGKHCCPEHPPPRHPCPHAPQLFGSPEVHMLLQQIPPAPQSAFVRHCTQTPLPLHTLPPLSLQMLPAGVFVVAQVPAEQAWDTHRVEEVGHGMPQLPQLATSVCVLVQLPEQQTPTPHAWSALFCPSGTVEHVPTIPARLQALHVPAHEVLQHTPSAQTPLVH